MKKVVINSLSDFTNRSNANSRMIISNDVTISSGVKAEIPENVTLVADGGILKGEGTIVGNRTKIDANFEQLFEKTLSFVGIWDISISHPEWFGESSEDIDCSTIIQKAIDILPVGYSDQYNNSPNKYPVAGYFTKGGKVVCKYNHKYLITKTIYLKIGHSFDGSNSNFIYGITSNLERYMFKINLNTSNQPITVQSGQFDIISNLRIINPKLLSDAYGIYSASQYCIFENIYTEYLFQTFKRYTNEYLDQITIRNFLIAWPQKRVGNTLYQIDMGYIGDNLMIDNVHTFIRSNSQTGEDGNDLLLRVNGCGGGVIQRILNGSIYIANSKSLTLSGVHQELGNIIIENSQIEINGWCHFKKPSVPALVNKSRTGSNEQRLLSLKNIMILYNHNKNTFDNKSLTDYDIQLSGASLVKFENVAKTAQQLATEASSLYGINVNHYGFMKNPANHSLNSLVCGSGVLESDEQLILNDFISYKVHGGNIIDAIYVSSGSDITNTIFGDNGNFVYYASILFDKDRNIGVNFEDRKLSTTIQSNTHHVSIQLKQSYYVGLIIRLFRKKEGSSDIYYIDLPVCTARNVFYDLGHKTLFGEYWKKITTLPSVQNCTEYQLSGNNIVVTMASRPISGNWRKGDIINLPSERLIYGYNFNL